VCNTSPRVISDYRIDIAHNPNFQNDFDPEPSFFKLTINSVVMYASAARQVDVDSDDGE
jgi:hypothetical protein